MVCSNMHYHERGKGGRRGRRVPAFMLGCRLVVDGKRGWQSEAPLQVLSHPVGSGRLRICVQEGVAEAVAVHIEGALGDEQGLLWKTRQYRHTQGPHSPTPYTPQVLVHTLVATSSRANTALRKIQGA